MLLLNVLKTTLQRSFRRQSHTPIKANFDGAGRGKRFKNWRSSNSSINDLLTTNLDTLLSRSRHAALNNPVAYNAIESIVSNCIGTGIKPQPKAQDSQFREQVQQLWFDWKDDADSSGMVNFYGLQSLTCRAMIEAGSCFIRLKVVTGKKAQSLAVPLQLQLIESEHLNRTINKRLENRNIIKSGIEFNRDNERIAYHLYKEHPGEQSSQGETIRVPADNMLHIYKPIRPGQIDGVPWLSRVLIKLHELDQYDDAELVRKKTTTLFAGFITRLDPDGNMMGEGETDEEGLAIAELEPGTMQLLEPGEDVKFSGPSDVGNSYDSFMRQQLRLIAIGMGISYEQLTGDLTQVNYSSIRAGLIEFRRKCEMIQHHIMIHQFCRPIWKKWFEVALLSGALKLPANANRYDAVKWIPQGWDWVDPLKDQQAQRMAVRNGFKSRSEVVSELGYDAEDIDQEIAADNARADDLGLQLDSDGRAVKS